MIVRIVGLGQWRIPDQLVKPLNVLDDLVMRAVDNRDDESLAELLSEMADLVKESGVALSDEPVVLSDLMIPNPTTSLDEVAEWLQESRKEDGLIPG